MEYKTSEKKREKVREYYAANSEKIKEHKRKNKKMNTEETREKNRLRQKKYRDANPEKVRKAVLKYAAAHPDRRRESQRKYRETHSVRLYAQLWKIAHPGYDKAAAFKRRYGITFEERDAMFEQQKGCCAICHKYHTDCPRGMLYLDHNHETKKSRALLCHNCNTGIGNLKDDIGLLQKAIEYLQKF